MLVLVVDDTAIVRMAMQMFLEAKGYEVIEAKHGGIGLELVASKKPDLVLLDLMMPEVDGFQFLTRLPSVTNEPPPVIVISGFDTYRDEVTKLGAFAYLEKPTDNNVLLRTMADALAKRQPDRQLLEEHREQHAVARDQAREQAQQLVRNVGQSDVRVMPGLQALVDWLPRFFGFGTTVIQTLRGNDLTIEAVGGDRINGRGMVMKPGMSVPRQWSFCDDLCDEGSTLVLPDPRNHISKLVAEHSEITRLKWGFYLGVAIPTSSGVVGALCHLAKEPNEAHSEDAELLTLLATRVGAMLEAAANNAAMPPLFDDKGCLTEDLASAVIDAAIKRAVRRVRNGVLLRIALSEHASSNVLYERMCALDGLSAVVIHGPENTATAILSGRERDATADDVQRCWVPGVRAIASARWDAIRPAPDLDRFETATMQANLLAEANRVFDMVLAQRAANG